MAGFLIGAGLVAALAFVFLRPKPEPPASRPAPAEPASAPGLAPSAEVEAAVARAPRIEPQVLNARLAKNEVTVIDVRQAADYAAGHIPGALQIPLDFVAGEIPWLSKDKLIVTYCSCPAEETSGRAVLTLQDGGLTNVAALKGGLDSWRALGFKIETGLPKPPQPEPSRRR